MGDVAELKAEATLSRPTPIVVKNSIVVNSPAGVVFELAAAIERWPDFLPHYRRVRIVTSHGGCRDAQMWARRGRIPVTWRCIQTEDRDAPAVRFMHTWGVTGGMAVEWRFEPSVDGATRVSIVHVLPPAGLLRRLLLRHVIVPQFIDYIAQRTLLAVKARAEDQSVA